MPLPCVAVVGRGCNCSVALAAAARQFEADGVLAMAGLVCPEDIVGCLPTPGGVSPVVNRVGGAPVAMVEGLEVRYEIGGI